MGEDNQVSTRLPGLSTFQYCKQPIYRAYRYLDIPCSLITTVLTDIRKYTVHKPFSHNILFLNSLIKIFSLFSGDNVVFTKSAHIQMDWRWYRGARFWGFPAEMSLPQSSNCSCWHYLKHKKILLMWMKWTDLWIMQIWVMICAFFVVVSIRNLIVNEVRRAGHFHCWLLFFEYCKHSI